MSDTKEQLHIDPKSGVRNGVEAHAKETAGDAENTATKETAGDDSSRAELIEAKRKRIEELEKSLGKNPGNPDGGALDGRDGRGDDRRDRDRRRSRSPGDRRDDRDRDRGYRHRDRDFDRGVDRDRGYSRDRDYERRDWRDDRRDRDYDRRDYDRYDRRYANRNRDNRRTHNKHGAREKMLQVEDPFLHLRKAAAVSADPLQQAKQMAQQQRNARQLVLEQQALSAIQAARKSQRELYIGNIAPGLVTESMLRELFRATLTAAFPEKTDEGTIDPVSRVSLVDGQKYAFVEFIDTEMATACIDLSGKVQLGGSVLSLGRPAGYRDPEEASAAAVTASTALAKFQAEVQLRELKDGEVTEEELEARQTPYLCIDGAVDKEWLRGPMNEDTKKQLIKELIEEDVQGELERHGTVLRAFLITDPADEAYFGKTLVHFLNASDAEKARIAIDGRLFDGRNLAVTKLQAKAFAAVAGILVDGA